MEGTHRQKKQVDSGQSWVIAFSCCFLNCLLYGVARLSGILMVATLETFQVSRASAALPFSVSTSVRNLSGLFVGFLGDKFGLRATIATGSILASVGAGLCFFAVSIKWIVVCWGGIFGLGFGMITCLLPLAINQHFNKYRGTASGISYSGSYIGSFIFPPMVVELLDKYALSGTFLVMSATFLNGLAVSTLFKDTSTGTDKSELQYCQQIEDTHTVSKEPHKNFWIRVWNKLKSKSRFLNGNVRPKDSSRSSIFYIDSLSTVDTDIDSPHCVLISYTDFSVVYPSSDFDWQTKRNVSSFKSCRLTQGYFSKRIRLKKKLRKFKSYGNFVIKKKYHLGEKYLDPFFENVKLISFKKINGQFSCIKELPKGRSIRCVLKGKPYSSLKSSEVINEEQYPTKELKLDNNCLEVMKQSQLEHKSNSEQRNNDQNILFVEAPKSLHEFDENKNNRDFGESGTKLNSTLSIPPSDSITNNANGNNDCTVARCSVLKNSFKCLFGWCRLYSEPMFVVIAITMSLNTFVMVCMITIIEDFAKDIGIPACSVHYVLMVLSTADLIGSLTLGVITDRGFLSRTNFIMICFFGMSLCQVAISYSRSYTALLTIVATYGVLESGVIITLPLLIDFYIPKKKQATAVASSNILSSPTVLLVPLLIGYFRDDKGCYSGVFYCLCVTSFLCSFIWLLAPHLCAKYHKKPKPSFQTFTSL